jgi:hypothetical protein
MNRTLAVIGTLAVAVAMSAGQVSAQTSPAPVAGGKTTIGVVGGLSTGAGSGAALGGSFTIGLNDHLAIEGTGSYLTRGSGADALSLNLGLLVSLLPPGREAIPYAAIGGGLYHASFDLGNNRFFGMMGSQYPPGTRMVPLQGMGGYGMMGGGYYGQSGMMGSWNPSTQGAWPGPTFTSGQMPMFYANRLGPMTVPQNGMWGMRSFTDPAMTFGGGVRLDLSRRLSVRPDARARVVFGGGESYTIGVFSFNVAYRFLIRIAAFRLAARELSLASSLVFRVRQSSSTSRLGGSPFYPAKDRASEFGSSIGSSAMRSKSAWAA